MESVYVLYSKNEMRMEVNQEKMSNMEPWRRLTVNKHNFLHNVCNQVDTKYNVRYAFQFFLYVPEVDHVVWTAHTLHIIQSQNQSTENWTISRD